MASCRACGATIVWERTTAGKAMPLDEPPTAEGNVLVRDGVAHVLGPLDKEALDPAVRQQLRMPHHATCPNWGR